MVVFTTQVLLCGPTGKGNYEVELYGLCESTVLVLTPIKE